MSNVAWVALNYVSIPLTLNSSSLALCTSISAVFIGYVRKREIFPLCVYPSMNMRCADPFDIREWARKVALRYIQSFCLGLTVEESCGLGDDSSHSSSDDIGL